MFGFGKLGRFSKGLIGSAAAVTSLSTVLAVQPSSQCEPNSLTKIRKTDFPLQKHSHGKLKVRALKIRRKDGKHEVSEFSVNTTLYSPVYERVFTKEDNTDLIATDTQKNTVYAVLGRTDGNTPEEFALDLAEHFMNEYSILTGVEVEVSQVPWRRSSVDGEPHDHSFEHPGNERWESKVAMNRPGTGYFGKGSKNIGTGTKPGMVISDMTSSIKNMTILKTTQSGFENFHRDRYRVLDDCTDRCLSTHLDCIWTYTGVQRAGMKFADIRDTVRTDMVKGLFGPSKGGVYSESLQATIYDAGCLVLADAPAVANISITTPNVHYLPVGKLLEQIGEKNNNDVFMPISEPSGHIKCTVGRS